MKNINSNANLNINLKEIERKISYFFKNKGLLIQAFTKDTYTCDYPNIENNQLLETLGDSVLDLVISDMLFNKFGYFCEYTDKELSDSPLLQYKKEDWFDEGKLTTIKQQIVDNDNLSNVSKKLEIIKYLRMGKKDINNHENEKTKTQADLIEAIIAAIYIDSNRDLLAVENSISFMLDLDDYFTYGLYKNDNYISLVQECLQKKFKYLPEYIFEEEKIKDDVNYNAILDLSAIFPNVIFKQTASSKNLARKQCAKCCFEYLKANNLLVTINDYCKEEDLTIESAINKLQELYQKKYVSMPVYEDKEYQYDKNGNLLWLCSCYVDNYAERWNVVSTSKTKAKKYASYLCLINILNYENKYKEDEIKCYTIV